MASPERPRAKRVVAAPPPFELLTDDLLAEILLRLPTLADLGRAAASCAAFSRVAASRAFLRRIRSVHPSPLLGLLGASSDHPAEPPHSSAPYARAFFGAADLSFSFVPCPGPDCWLPVDARDRDGRVLLVRYVKRPLLLGGIILIPLFAVCDPLSRRYSLLPEIPEDPVSRCGIKPFLVPARDQQEETSFRVVSAAIDAAGKLFAFVFSSATGEWSRSAVGAGVQRPGVRQSLVVYLL